jgi:glucose/mannose-6-phosphate isomerase
VTVELHEELLSDAEAAEAADRGSTLRLIAASGARIRRAAALREFDEPAAQALDLMAQDGRPRAAVVIGYGTGATIAGLIGAAAGAGATVPIVPVPGPALPGWVGPLDLVVVASTAGRAPEICQALGEAARRGSRVVCIAPGSSPVGELCQRVRGTLIAMGDEQAPVWARFWSVAVPVFIALETAGVLPRPDYEAAAAAADETAVRCRPSQEPFVNPAKEIALRIAESSAAVWAGGRIAAIAAERFADQVALRAGLLVSHAALADLGRGQLGLLDGPLAAGSADPFYDPFEDGGAAASGRAAVVLISEEGVDPRTAVAEALVREKGMPLTTFSTQYPDPLARAAQLVALADFSAAYVALLTGADADQGRTIEEYRLRTAQ